MASDRHTLKARQLMRPTPDAGLPRILPDAKLDMMGSHSEPAEAGMRGSVEGDLMAAMRSWIARGEWEGFENAQDLTERQVVLLISLYYDGSLEAFVRDNSQGHTAPPRRSTRHSQDHTAATHA
jgi:hypothetical protein